MLLRGRCDIHDEKESLQVFPGYFHLHYGGCNGYDVNEENYALVGSLDKVFPVDVYVLGCPPKPEAIIQGIAKAIQVLSTKAVSSKSLRR